MEWRGNFMSLRNQDRYYFSLGHCNLEAGPCEENDLAYPLGI